MAVFLWFGVGFWGGCFLLLLVLCFLFVGLLCFVVVGFFFSQQILLENLYPKKTPQTTYIGCFLLFFLYQERSNSALGVGEY